MATSAPRPVSERTYSSSNLAAVGSLVSIVPSQQPMNPSGMLMIPGFASEYHERAALGVGARPHGRADHHERDRADHAEQHARDRTGGVEARHVSASSSAGKLALAATANARPTMNEMFRPRRR